MVQTRSVPKQTEPYPPLVDVTSEQIVFEYKDVQGTLVGFWCPEYAEGVNFTRLSFAFYIGRLYGGRASSGMLY